MPYPILRVIPAFAIALSLLEGGIRPRDIASYPIRDEHDARVKEAFGKNDPESMTCFRSTW
jgi:hypothetical protein